MTPHKTLRASIVLTTWNGGDYLREQLDTIINQTYQNLEILISDDRSNEYTLNIIKEYMARDPRIVFYANEFAQGCHPNNNFAVSKVTGDVFFFCDQDDTWDLTKVAKHMHIYHTMPEVAWVYNKLTVTDITNTIQTGLLTDQVPDYYRDKSMLENAWGSCIGAAMTSYRTSVAQHLFPMGKGARGHDSWIQLAMWPAKSYFIDEFLQTYRQHLTNDAGWKTDARSDEEIKATEKKAIENNLIFLRELMREIRLPLWKRIFFGAVYYGKILRAKLRAVKNK